MDNIVNQVRNFVLNNFQATRVNSLILYGSALSKSAIIPKDHDFILLLDTYNPSDYLTLRLSRDRLPIELFIDYKDQIIKKGFDNYQRGRHGIYFFLALAHAESLIGSNFYKENIDKISMKLVKRDLLFRIEEYFYRLQKHYLNSDESNFNDFDFIEKYISRIFFDLLLFKDKISFNHFYDVHYKDIFDKYINDSTDYSEIFKKQFCDFISNKCIDNVPYLIAELYKVYLESFEVYNEKHNSNEISKI